MDPFLLLILLLSLIAFALVGEQLLKEKTRRLNDQANLLKQAREKRLLEIRERTEPYRRQLPKMKSLSATFNSYENWDTGYFNHFKLSEWEADANKLFQKFQNLDFSDYDFNASEVTIIKDFLDMYRNRSDLRKASNQSKLLDWQIRYEAFFNNIEGRSLDMQQRTAIICDEDNNLVIAGAGSGKTSTIVGKVAFLTKIMNVPPENILAISFTRKSSTDLKHRIEAIAEDDIDVMTFHSLGRKIIAEVTGKKPSVAPDEKYSKTIAELFKTHCNDKDYLDAVLQYFAFQSKPFKDPEEFESRGEYIQYLKDNNLKTLKGEQVKSLEELSIANFLFLNGLEYTYERRYEFDTATREYAQYRPDFYLEDFDIYIEHFGIDENGNVPHWFGPNNYEEANLKYNQSIKWKRELHEFNNTTMIETYSWENKKGILLDELERKLFFMGIPMEPVDPQEAFAQIKQNNSFEITSFTKLIGTFISLLKSNNKSIAEIEQIIEHSGDLKFKVRSSAFLQILEPIFDSYQSKLENDEEIDFHDMINMATQYVTDGHYDSPYDYIIIDEFQDISYSRYNLIKSLLNACKGSKSFCVGDDWQSIFRFSGSDISIFTEFEKLFGVTAVSRIETTYRFGTEVIEKSSQFILKNPFQIEKNLKPAPNSDYGTILLHDITNKQNIYTPQLVSILSMAAKEYSEWATPPKIFLLGRYKRDLDQITQDENTFQVKYNRHTETYSVKFLPNPNALDIEFLTVHKSKGLESNVTILLNCSSGRYGFPSQISDDPVLGLVLSKSDQFPHSEERRLFYVALTRARALTVVFYNPANPSSFVAELQANEDQNNLCPNCLTGRLSTFSGTTNGNNWTKVSCSNWNMGCDYVTWL